MITIIKLFIILGIAALIGRKAFKLVKDHTGYTIFKPNYAVITAVVIWVFLSSIILSGVGQVNPGQRGVVVRLGAVTGRIIDEGIYYITPLVEKVEIMSVQVYAFPADASSASRDMQEVKTQVTLNYQLDPAKVAEIFQYMRYDYGERVITPAIQESVKAATAQFDAESLIGRREDVRQKIKELLIAKLQTQYGIIVRDISITDFNFSPEFNVAIEAKATAIQQAEKAKRDLERIKMEAQQRIETAKAEAEALRVQKMNVTAELIQLRQIEVQRDMVQKWDGKMPMVVGSSTGLLLQLPVPQAQPQPAQ